MAQPQAHALDHEALHPGHDVVHLWHDQAPTQDGAQQRKRGADLRGVLRAAVAEEPGQQEAQLRATVGTKRGWTGGDVAVRGQSR